MGDAGFYRGTSSEQDSRFTDKERKLLKQMRFDGTLDEKICMDRVNLDVLKPWITAKLNDILDVEDDVLIEYVFSQLEEKTLNPKVMQINLTGFLNARRAREFMGELWAMLIEAQSSDDGIPASLVEKKMKEIQERAKIITIATNGASDTAGSDWQNRYDSLTGGKYGQRENALTDSKKEEVKSDDNRRRERYDNNRNVERDNSRYDNNRTVDRDNARYDNNRNVDRDNARYDRNPERDNPRYDHNSGRGRGEVRRSRERENDERRVERKREREERPQRDERRSRDEKEQYKSGSPSRRRNSDDRVERSKARYSSPKGSPPRRRFTERKDEVQREQERNTSHRKRKLDSESSGSEIEKLKKKKKKKHSKKHTNNSDTERSEKKKKKRKKEKKHKKMRHSSESD